MDELLKSLGIHGPLAAAVLGAVMWGRSHISVNERHHSDNLKKFDDLERTRREDLKSVFDAIQHTADQNNEILKILATRDRGDR